MSGIDHGKSPARNTVTTIHHGSTDMRKRHPKSESTSAAVEKVANTQPPTRAALLAKCGIMPTMRHAAIQRGYGSALIQDDESEWMDTVAALGELNSDIADGNLRLVSNTLASQALTLDAMFTQLASRAASNMGQYPEAFSSYMRLALKAQANSRATLEALAKLHQPREQIIKHVHVNSGGQAIVTEEFHHHQPGGQNAKSGDQPHAATTGAIGASPALPCPDAIGQAVPVPVHAKRPLPNARRKVTRRAKGQS